MDSAEDELCMCPRGWSWSPDPHSKQEAEGKSYLPTPNTHTRGLTKQLAEAI